jgi:hypothetical protein
MPAVVERVKTESDNHWPMISVIREVTKELYAGEDEEVKAIVAAAPEVPLEDNDASRTPQQYQE